MKKAFTASTLFIVFQFSIPSQASSCQTVSNVSPSQSPSSFAKNSLGIQFLGHGTSIASARAAIVEGALLSSLDQHKEGTFATVGTRKDPLKGIFTQAIFKPEWLEQVLNYKVSVPLDPQYPDDGGTIETRQFEVILLFDLRPLDESAFYAAPGWSYDPPIEKYASDNNGKLHLLESLRTTDILPTVGRTNLALANEVVFNLPNQGLSFKYLVEIHIHGDSEHVQKVQTLLSADLRQANWNDEDIAQLFAAQSY